MLEKVVESYLKKRVKQLGGECIKLTGMVGVPDRLVLLPGGQVAFVELKRPGERPRQIQYYWIYRLKELGYRAGWCDSVESVDRLLQEMADDKRTRH